LAKTEGILAALESAHALAYLIKRASEFSPSHVVVINLSGRGDKDVQQLARFLQKTT
jgi:tryptophan synthase beta chain